MKIRKTVSIVVTSFFIAIFVIFVIFPILPNLLPHSNIKIVDYNLVHTAGLLSVDYVLSGRVVNSGNFASNPITLKLTISDNNGNILYTTNTAPDPSILQPGQEAAFSKHFTDSDIGGYTGRMTYKIQVMSE